MLAVLLALGSSVFAAFVSIVSKMALKGIDSTTLTVVRSVIMSILLIGVGAIKGVSYKTLQGFSTKEWILLILSGALGVISWLLYFAALKLSKSTTLIYVLDKTSVVWVFVFSILLLGEKFGIRSVIGVVMITLGILLMG